MDGFIKEHPTQLAYLAGAGISVAPPAALPGAAQFITALTEKITDDPTLKAAITDRLFIETVGKDLRVISCVLKAC
ncbi:MAG: hypothetical protein IPM81_05120 [Saprospirales bacterium]|nr:hypothetical protein [Saprospirales bacterium]